MAWDIAAGIIIGGTALGLVFFGLAVEGEHKTGYGQPSAKNQNDALDSV